MSRYNPRALQIPALTTRSSTRKLTQISALFAAAIAVLPQTASAGAILPDSPQSPVASKVNLLYIVFLVFGLLAIIGVIAA
ncbi:MAG: hypothetical protein ACRDKI_07985, partial [Solirubrobacterales bacterium]